MRLLYLPLIVLLTVAHGIAAPGRKRHKPASPSNAFGKRPEVVAFVQAISEKHHWNPRYIKPLFAKLTPNPKVLELVSTPAVAAPKNWEKYQSHCLDSARIQAGKAFKEHYARFLSDLNQTTGVPETVILGILGVETRYGRETGKFPLLQTLTTLAFDYPDSPKQAERKALFKEQIEALILLCIERRKDPKKLKGSFAGAMGIPQFLPSSLREHGADGDGDGKVDIAKSPKDAMASVARFLLHHGWEKGQPVVWPVPDTQANRLVLQPLADGHPLPKHKLKALLTAGLSLNVDPTLCKRFQEENLILIDLPTPQQPTRYALGFKNFYAITRYNRSFFYAMGVWNLGEAVCGMPSY